MSPRTALNGTPSYLPQTAAVAVLLAVGTLFAANHVAARMAFDEGTGLLLALLVRSSVALVLMLALVGWNRQPLAVARERRAWQLLLGVMIAGQSLCLYSAVARIPVAVALLLINTWPIFLALLTWALGGGRPSPRLVMIMGIILLGVMLVLDIPAWLDNPGLLGPGWLPGVFFALSGSLFFAVAIWVTEHRLSGMSGAVRSAWTMATVLALIALAGGLGLMPGGLNLPGSAQGWLGLALLSACYGVAATVIFVLVPRLNMARNAPVMNFEPVAALLLGYVVLGQVLNVGQLLGGAIVLGCIVWLSVTRQF